MGAASATPQVLIYAPYSFSGRGPAETCARIAGGMVAGGVQPVVFAGRQRSPLPEGVAVRRPLRGVSERLPWRGAAETIALARLEQQFLRALTRCDPRITVAHFWPGTPTQLVDATRAAGVITVREMINSALATAGVILDEAYSRLGLPTTHGITASAIADETHELSRYDYVFASNAEVETSLRALGVSDDRILATTFGWLPEHYAGTEPAERDAPFRALFVGRIGVRKGIPELLDGWSRTDVDGELVLVGSVDSEIAELVERHRRGGRVRVWGYAPKPGPLYASADVFVFPTLEEGGPQVTYEAAGFGLPVVTTSMGAARLVEDGRTGLIVPPASPERIAAALQSLADHPERRASLGRAAAAAAESFSYDKVGASRAQMLRRLLADR